MQLSRDSAVWWVAFAGAVLGYLSQAPAPTEWTYPEWIRAASVLVAWLAGKLASSPLRGAASNDKE